MRMESKAYFEKLSTVNMQFCRGPLESQCQVSEKYEVACIIPACYIDKLNRAIFYELANAALSLTSFPLFSLMMITWAIKSCYLVNI